MTPAATHDPAFSPSSCDIVLKGIPWGYGQTPASVLRLCCGLRCSSPSCFPAPFHLPCLIAIQHLPLCAQRAETGPPWPDVVEVWWSVEGLCQSGEGSEGGEGGNRSRRGHGSLPGRCRLREGDGEDRPSSTPLTMAAAAGPWPDGQITADP